MAEELGFRTAKRGDRRVEKCAPAGSPRGADDPSHGTLTRDALDVADYITNMTARLAALAIEARLERLAYFLHMANTEGEMFVRINAAAKPSAEEESKEPAIALHQKNNRFD